MTCIVAIEKDGVVTIGGDSAGIDGYDVTIRTDEKVFGNDDFLFGFAGSFRMGQLLRYALVPPEQTSKKSDMAFLVTDFMDAVRYCLRDHGAIRKDNEEDEALGCFIFAYNGKLYVVDSDFQVGCPKDGYAAVGSGAQVALGSLHATSQLEPVIDPKKRIEIALMAASHFNAGVRAPFTILSSEDDDVELDEIPAVDCP